LCIESTFILVITKERNKEKRIKYSPVAPPFIYTPFIFTRGKTIWCRIGSVFDLTEHADLAKLMDQKKDKVPELILLNLKIEGMVGKTGLKDEQRFV
jgi:hypothetical protein